jgi:tRNA uridine 5-carbamoylmethylation protein Kti12
MLSGGLDLNNIYAWGSLVIPIISLIASMGKARKKDTAKEVAQLRKELERLEAVDREQQQEINRHKRMRGIDKVRIQQLHDLVRDGNPALRAEINEVKSLLSSLRDESRRG